MASASDILAHAFDQEAEPKFDPREPRVSKIGLCARRQVAEALGLIESTIPPELAEAGHLLELAAFNRIASVKGCRDAVHEPSVETWVPGVMCHPDIILPTNRHVIQVKSVRTADSGSWGDVAPYHRDQVLGEWAAFRATGGFYPRGSQRKYPFLPERYELLYLCRESWGLKYISVPVPWDRVRAEELKRKFLSIAAHIILEKLPPVPMKPEPDCQFSLTNRCPLFDDCESKRR